MSSLVNEVSIERRSNGLAAAESRRIVAKADAERRILETQGSKAEARNRAYLADALGALPTRFLCKCWKIKVLKDTTYPIPVVMLTFSKRVSWETNSFALA